MIDLHLHSTASDGSHAPAEVVAIAAGAGVRTLALTDHDTVGGIDEAARAATDHGVDLLPGIEISVAWERRTLHVVGLGIDPAHPGLLALTRGAADTRINRARAIGKSLAKAGIDGALLGASDIAGGEDNLSRSHFARFLVAEGHAKDNRQVFRRFLVRGKPGYARADWVPLAEAVGTIRNAGGLAVLAHPARYKVNAGKLRRALEDFRTAGGAAMEVSCGGGNARELQTLAGLAQEYGLAASQGSDFHGPDKPWARPGKLLPLPADCIPVMDLLTRR